MKPAMTDGEIDFLSRHISKSRRHLEFGCGGSTLVALSHGIGHVYSVESSLEWVQELRKLPEVGAAEQAGRLTLSYIDVGPTKEWGWPAGDEAAVRWPGYYTDIWQTAEVRELDSVLIDGRFRIACGLAALANCRKGTVILVHDWHRSHYRRLAKFARVIEELDHIVALEAAATIDWRRFGIYAQRHALDPR